MKITLFPQTKFQKTHSLGSACEAHSLELVKLTNCLTICEKRSPCLVDIIHLNHSFRRFERCYTENIFLISFCSTNSLVGHVSDRFIKVRKESLVQNGK